MFGYLLCPKRNTVDSNKTSIIAYLLPSSFKELSPLTLLISISQYSTCTCSTLLRFLVTFEYLFSFIFKLFILYFSSANLTSILFISFSDFFVFSLLAFSLLNEVSSFSCFLMCITTKLRNIAL